MAEEQQRRKKRIISKGGDEQEPWLITYSDLMTLLMTFFVLLFAMSTIDPVKLEQFGNSVGEALGKKKE
ncbi:MAG: flagellar motor protein MotB, partial [Candidatus Marinimicrobia bacterium]|nr:flagellar motor protein MotB [Candidatus Neomarinimicrobiota bacterium]